MALQLRELNAVAEDLGLILRTHRNLTAICNSSSQESNTLFLASQAIYTCGTLTVMQANTNTHKIFKILRRGRMEDKRQCQNQNIQSLCLFHSEQKGREHFINVRLPKSTTVFIFRYFESQKSDNLDMRNITPLRSSHFICRPFNSAVRIFD